jgi:transcription antitermination protein NusB
LSARTKARKRALDVMYECDLRGSDPRETLVERRDQGDPPIHEYATVLIEGVLTHRERIDELISTYAQGWEIDRMPVVDRNLLRLAIYEVMYADEIPDSVAIDEALDLARLLSTDESAAFVNGVLGQIVIAKPLIGR